MKNAQLQKALFSILDGNSSSELVLKNVYFVEEDQATLTELLTKIGKNTSVTSLIIDGIGITGNTIGLVVHSFKTRLQKVKINEEALKGKAADNVISCKLTLFPQLTSLDLSGCKIGEEGCKALNELLNESKNLKELRLDSCALDDKQVQRIFSLIDTGLKILSLKRNSIGPQSVDCLKISTLEELNLGHNLLGIEGVKNLIIFFTSSSLVTLDIKLNYINNTSIKVVCSEEFEGLVLNFIKANTSRQITFYDLTEGVNAEVSNLHTRIAQQKGIISGNATLLGAVNLMQDYDGNQRR